MTLHRRRFVATSVAGAVGFAGCMGDGDETDENATDGTGDAMDGTGDAGDDEVTGTQAREAYPDYDWSQLEGVTPTATDTISIEDNAFVPLVANVPVDTRIAVSNEDGIPHTFTVPRAGIDEQIGGSGETSVRFDQVGTYEYVCKLHPPSMVGRLVIEEGVEP